MFPAAFVDGAVLAAIVLDDREGVALRGFCPGLARAVAARKAELDALPREHRHREVRALVGAVGAVPPAVELPARVRAILLTDAAPDGIAHRAPRVRRAFRVSRGLRETLRRLAWDEVGEDGRSMHGTDLGLHSPPARSRARELALVAEAPWRG